MSITEFIDIFIHLDQYLNAWAASMGPWLYVVLFLVVFCETGLVVTPFLPGDSLLFAVGAMTVTTNAVLSFPILLVSLIVAGVFGDFVNYTIGRKFGLALFKDENSKFFNRMHLLKTQKFYEKHGAKTIVLARYIPIVRTFAPFVAGMGQMQYRRFAVYNVIGAVSWVGIFLTLGRLFGNMPAVKKNFQFVILGIIIVSVLPIVFEWWKARRAAAAA
ncbi:MAG: DedA family protein [Bdellovibrionaceae bacterium]|nr:DedA family protein [Pseudobdellovibrionaceae bacterium]